MNDYQNDKEIANLLMSALVWILVFMLLVILLCFAVAYMYSSWFIFVMGLFFLYGWQKDLKKAIKAYRKYYKRF